MSTEIADVDHVAFFIGSRNEGFGFSHDGSHSRITNPHDSLFVFDYGIVPAVVISWYRYCRLLVEVLSDLVTESIIAVVRTQDSWNDNDLNDMGWQKKMITSLLSLPIFCLILTTVACFDPSIAAFIQVLRQDRSHQLPHLFAVHQLSHDETDYIFDPATVSKKIVIVAGATGYIGKAVVKESVRQGYYTVALIRDAVAVDDNLRLQWNGAEIVECDVTDGEDVLKVNSTTVVELPLLYYCKIVT